MNQDIENSCQLEQHSKTTSRRLHRHGKTTDTHTLRV